MAGGEDVAAAATIQCGTTVGATRIPTPAFSEDNLRMYMEEIEVWMEVCGIPKRQQGMFLWMNLPRDTPSDIKESISTSLGLSSRRRQVLTSSSTP